MIRLSSSLRRISAEDTIARAMVYAPTLGITRITDTTWLDRIGIPVFASIRPAAIDGSLCVNAGKGLRPIEARVGAYMEAIEFAMAECPRAHPKPFSSTVDEIAGSLPPYCRFVDFCPVHGVKIEGGMPIHAVNAVDIVSGKHVLVPAELVYAPFDTAPYPNLFGQSTTGLCSGNDLVEATLHGLSEVIERDVEAFNRIVDRAETVALDAPPPAIGQLVEQITRAGLEVVLRHCANEYSLPFFQAFILERAPEAPVSVAQGTGLHPVKSIAAVRAICEAAQSRLSHIHGGRDDIIERVQYFERIGRSGEIAAIRRLRQRIFSGGAGITYSDVPDAAEQALSIEDALESLLDKLRTLGIHSVLRVELTPEEAPVKVVRIIVPKMETFQPSLRRVGPRLAQFVGSLA